MGYNPTSFPNDPLLSQESFRLGCHIQPHFAQPIMMMLDVRSLEFVRQKEADKNRRQAEEKKRQKEHFKDF
jgi:hypothetical protein